MQRGKTGETVAGELDAEQWDRFKQYAEDHGLNKSQAVRRLTDAGLREHGYKNGHGMSYLKQVAFEVARAICYIAAAGLAISLFSVFDFWREAALLLLFAPLFFLISDNADQIEGWFRGDKA